MKKLLVIVLLLSSFSYAAMVDIIYSVKNISGDQWVYNYTVSNNGLAQGIEEFAITFNYGMYSSLEVVTDEPLSKAWDEIVWDPSVALQNNGAYDALALSAPISIGETVSGFAVSFNCEGEGNPGKQYFEVVNPDDVSDVYDSGYTILPELGIC